MRSSEKSEDGRRINSSPDVSLDLRWEGQQGEMCKAGGSGLEHHMNDF